VFLISEVPLATSCRGEAATRRCLPGFGFRWESTALRLTAPPSPLTPQAAAGRCAEDLKIASMHALVAGRLPKGARARAALHLLAVSVCERERDSDRDTDTDTYTDTDTDTDR